MSCPWMTGADVERILVRRQPLDAVVLAGGVDEDWQEEPTSYTGWPNCWLKLCRKTPAAKTVFLSYMRLPVKDVKPL